MSSTTQTTEQKTFFGKLLAAIGGFFIHLLSGAKTAFNELSPEQQQALINGVNISQIIKENYSKGETAVVELIATQTGLPNDVVAASILAIAKDAGINITSVQGYLDALADKVQAGITDNGWNSLFSDIAAFGASWLSTGSLNWISLSMGLIEFVYQHSVASKTTTA
jgi:hypothetical protein